MLWIIWEEDPSSPLVNTNLIFFSYAAIIIFVQRNVTFQFSIKRVLVRKCLYRESIC